MIRKLFFYSLLSISAFLVFFPSLYALSTSFMTSKEIITGAVFPSSFSFEAYRNVITDVPMLHYMKVSFIMSSIVMIGQLIVCSLAAYAFVFIPFKGRNLIFILFLSTMMIPWESTIIPNYITISRLNWLDTYMGLTVVYFASPFGVFLLRQHFLTLPHEIWESAQVEGCSRFMFYVKFALPLSKSSLTALAIYGYLHTWNKYLWPLLITNDDTVRTVQIGMKRLIATEGAVAWNNIMAGAVLVLLPTLLLLFVGMKYIREGLTGGAVKG